MQAIGGSKLFSLSFFVEQFSVLYSLLDIRPSAPKKRLCLEKASQRVDMDSYPDFDTLALATKLKVIVLRKKMNRKQLAKDAEVSPSSLSRIVGGYERFTQDAARDLLLKVSKVLVLKCNATKNEVDTLFELARNACPTNKTIVLEMKKRKLPYLYRPLDRENGELEAEILDLLENQ
jgi:hypothetical protein